MSNLVKAEDYLLDTQETYHENSNKKDTLNKTQNTNLNDSQDFHLFDFEGDDSMTEKTESLEHKEDNFQKLADQSNLQQTLPCSKIDDKLVPENDNDNVNENDNENKIIKDEEMTGNEYVKKTNENVSIDLCNSEKKVEFFDNDEDEVIQGTPPHSHIFSKKVDGDIEGASLKRKAEFFDEPPNKILRMKTTQDVMNTKEQFEEESHQSYKSDDSYEELFKNAQRNVIIEETQDPGNEFTEDNLKKPNLCMETADKIQELCLEHTHQQDEVFSEKCCDIEKDENLNVSVKLTDTSANDSTVVNANSLHEDSTQIEEKNLSIEVKKNNISSSAVINEKFENDILDDTNALLKTKEIQDTDTLFDANDKIEQTKCIESTKITESGKFLFSKIPDELQSKVTSSRNLRTSVELVYDGVNKMVIDKNKSKPEIVEIDEDGEIILDSSTEMIYDRQTNKTVDCEDKPNNLEVVEINDSHEEDEKNILDRSETKSQVTTANRNVYDNANETMNKTCHDNKASSDVGYKTGLDSTKSSLLDSRTDSNRWINGSSESKKCNDTDATLSVESDTFSNCDVQSITHSPRKIGPKASSFGPKDLDNTELISISDQEHDVSNVDDSTRKFELVQNISKTTQVEKEISMYVKLKCLLQIDENTKEYLGKELTAVHCETGMIESASVRKNDDTGSSSLADISDNKDGSPGSVNSNPQLYLLNPSRLSIMSSISSSSSASSAASLAAKLAHKDSMHFSLPRGPPKHAKKPSQDVLPPSLLTDKQALDESYERLTREWSNNRLLTTTILNWVNAELSTMDIYNVSSERLDHHLQKMHSSTPEIPETKIELITTPKSTKKGKVIRKARSKMVRSNMQTNNENNCSATAANKTPICDSVAENKNMPNKKILKLETNDSDVAENKQLLISETDVLANSSPLPNDDLIGKNVFAKWSDNNYYPGIVIDRLKTKCKVNFYDGKNKTLIPDFVIPIPKTLKEGLSVYATTSAIDYGTCGIIVDVNDNDNETSYTVETDEGERLCVQVKDIFLSADQAQVLKEELDTESSKALSTTPKHLGQVSLDNMVDGKRRSKRIGTPLFSTPKFEGTGSSSISKMKQEPSVSGMAAKFKRKRNALSENEGLSSDSTIESIMQDENVLYGVQKEIIGTPYEQIVKGPQSRIKSKPRSKKKTDEQTIATLGPIPTNSNIFKGMSFILTCAPLDALDRYQHQKTSTSSTEETEETETENEEEWIARPFVRDRLQMQIVAGGGKIYENFDDIPKSEYKNTKLITNVPNTTAKSILCLSVGIAVYNHKWIIRCCLEGKLVNAAEEALPTGWSLQKRAYVEIYQTNGKPLSKVVVIIPNLASDRQFSTFWRQVCENSGAVVLIAENSGNMKAMDFDSEQVVIISNQRCPLWAVEKAIQSQIPLLSTTWVVQCLIEGKLCVYDQHPRYKYNYMPN